MVNHASASSYSNVLKLFSGEKLTCCRVELVLKYHNPNQHEDLEEYAHYLLFMLYLFRDNSQLRISNSLSIVQNYTAWIDRINQNKALIEPFSELLDATFAKFRMDLVSDADHFSQQKNDEVRYNLSETEHDEHEQDNYDRNNGRDQCHNSNNLPGKVRTTVLDDQDMKKLHPLTLNKEYCLSLFCMTGLSL